jgi:hypothetical protein
MATNTHATIEELLGASFYAIRESRRFVLPKASGLKYRPINKDSGRRAMQAERS